MIKYHLFFLFVTLISISGCKKDNHRINKPTYQLDSVIVSNFDIVGNSEDLLRLSVADDNTSTIMDWISNGSTYLNYREHADSINIEVNQVTCAADPNTEIISFHSISNKQLKETSFLSLIGCYGQEGALYSRQYLTYLSDKKLNTLSNHFLYSIAGGPFQESRHTSEFSYNGNLLNSIHVNYIQYGNYHNDSLLYQLSNEIFYTHQYSNQSDMIGIDLNDISLIQLIQISILPLPLILSKKLSFNIQTDYLIEHIHFPQTPVSFTHAYGINPVLNHPDHATDLYVDYEFDTLYNNRIQSMTIRILPELNFENSIRYTFKYKD